jgi:hypothetical protein
VNITLNLIYQKVHFFELAFKVLVLLLVKVQQEFIHAVLKVIELNITSALILLPERQDPDTENSSLMVSSLVGVLSKKAKCSFSSKNKLVYTSNVRKRTYIHLIYKLYGFTSAYYAV